MARSSNPKLPAGRPRPQSSGARAGKVTLLALIFLLLIVVLASLIGNAGHTVNQKMETQNAADAIAFSSSLWLARGMNTITTSNHLVGEATALAVIHEAIGGPELRLGLSKNTPENQQLDGVIQVLSRSAPMGRIPSPYVPPSLTTIDRRVIELVTRRTSPSPAKETTAFATLYDSRLTLKRELAGWLAAKSIANLAFLVPPPFGYVPAIGAYAVHIAASAQIALIGKEWLLLDVLEKYAVVATPVQRRVIEAEWIPALSQFAAETAGLEMLGQEFSRQGGLATRSALKSVNTISERNGAEGQLFPGEQRLQLPVEFEPKPDMQGRQGDWPQEWGEDRVAALPDVEDAQQEMESKLDKALSEMQERGDQLAKSIEELETIRESVEERASAADPTLKAEYDAELQELEKTIESVKQEATRLVEDESNIRRQRGALAASLGSLAPGPSQNFSLDHIPTAMNPEQERVSQWVRAATPNVDALRAPILGLMVEQLPKSHAAEHFIKWTNRFALVKAWQFRSGQRLQKSGAASARWEQRAEPLGMLVLPGTFRDGRPSKGDESWTGQGRGAKAEAEELFTVVAAAHRSFDTLFAKVIHPVPHDHGLTSVSQAILYNANPQRGQTGRNDRQPVVGWDTLNWEHSSQAVVEWGAQAARQPARWPWELFDALDSAPSVKLNWQAKLSPLTKTRLQQAAQEISGEVQTAVELAAEHSQLLTH